MAAMPGASLPQQMGGWAQLRATYRMLANEKVSHERLSSPHWQATRQRAAQEAAVLMVMDTTYLIYNRYAKTMKELGDFGDGNRGLLVHSTLAVVPGQRQVLGLAHQQAIKPERIPEGQSRHKRPKEERQSRVWIDALKAMEPAGEGSCQVVVADREGDHTDFLIACRERGYHFLVRAAYDRCLAGPGQEGAHSLTAARSWEAMASKELDLPARSARKAISNEPARPKREARRAQLRVAWGEISVRVRRNQETPPLRMWLIRVWEVGGKEGVEPLEWFLMTSVPVRTAEDALERVEWYTYRWTIEDYHQCLKTGCEVEERDFEEAARVERLLGFLGPIAVRLLQLRDQARLNPEMPASTVADESTVLVLAAKRKVPAEGMTVRAFWRGVAQLGGFLGRRCDGEPGWQTIWRGWLYLQNLVEGASLAHALHPR
jgi:hypothetical protein